MSQAPRYVPGSSTLPPPQRIVPAPPWRLGAARWDFRLPLIMGVLNATPDSFSDGGEFLEVEAALAHGRQLVADGADLIDLGGASSHPLAKPVSVQEELDRIGIVLERLLKELPVPLSIDTQKPEVAEHCLRLGAHLVNDVSGMTDGAMAQVAAKHHAPLVVMFNTLTVPKGAGPDLLPSMERFFEQRIAQAEAAGVQRLILDPGYGFGKTLEENLTVLRGLGRLRRFERPILACTSRKGSLGRITGEANPKERLGATLATSLYAVCQGAHMVRVHDVKAFHQELRMWEALEGQAVP
ncbi:MAG TPA: dihydropteroate synthase [bacterium]